MTGPPWSIVNQEVHQLVHDHVLERRVRHLGERLADPQPTISRIERPERSHLLDAELADRDAQDRLPAIEDLLDAPGQAISLLVVRDLAIELAGRLREESHHGSTWTGDCISPIVAQGQDAAQLQRSVPEMIYVAGR